MNFWLAVAFAEPDELFGLAQAADASGWHGIAISDHISYPRHLRSPYPYTDDGRPGWQPETSWPDPWVTIGALAAITTNLHFTTNVYVAPARDMFTVAKAVSTAAVLSGDRVSVGVAPGWCEEEFVVAGQDFRTRGRRLDEMIHALRQLLTGEWTEFQGEHVRFDEVKISPTPSRRVPVYIGGDGPRALRRAATIGDGWIGTLYRREAAVEKLQQMRSALSEAGRDGTDFEIMMSLLARDDLETFRQFADLGVTGIIHAPWILAQPSATRSLRQARLDAIQRFGEDYIAKLR
jgi:probable F420-dependent oxidoreductase